MRLYMGQSNGRRAISEIGEGVDFVYERFAAFQSLGRHFKQRGVTWILETNAPIFYEAKEERKTVVCARLARRLELQSYRECDVLVCVTQALKEMVVREAEISPRKVLVMPNGVDLDIFDPARHSARRLFGDFVIGYVGSLIEWQKLDMLIDVVGDLRSNGLAMSLAIIGDGPELSTWEERARRAGIKQHVSFVGQVSPQEVPRYIAGFDVGYSGQARLRSGVMYLSPLKLYEYMSMGKPVIASRFEDSERVVRDGENGFLFVAEQKADLKRALTRAYESRQKLSEMGLQARAAMLSGHSWLTRVEGMMSGVDAILTGRG